MTGAEHTLRAGFPYRGGRRYRMAMVTSHSTARSPAV